MLMLDDFEITKSAKFFKLSKAKKPTKADIERFFRNSSENKEGNYLLKTIREKISSADGRSAMLSAICYKVIDKPSFLTTRKLLETKYAYLILVEFGNYMAILKKNSGDLASELKGHIELFTSSEISRYSSNSIDEHCERLSVRGMAISKYSILQKSYEAFDLNDSLPTTNSHRQIPNTAKFRNKDSSYSIAISTSRITEHSERINLEQLATWCFIFKDKIENNAPSSFLQQFSNSINLKDIPANTYPNGLLLTAHELIESLHSDYEISFNKRPIRSSLLSWLIQSHAEPLEASAQVHNATQLNGRIDLEVIRNKNTFTLKSKYLSKISLRNKLTRTEKTLTSILNDKGLFTLTFNDPRFFYSQKRIYRDNEIINNFERITEIFEPITNFAKAITEKGEIGLSGVSTDFPTHSLFYRVQEHFSKGVSKTIICDDLGSKEWADHFIIENSNNPKITLVHSKASNKLSHGASSMQEVVSQAIKNIGKTNLGTKELNEKKKLWTAPYKTKKFQTSIKRIASQTKNFEQLTRIISRITSSPKTTKTVAIAVNFIEKTEITKIFEKAKINQLASHETQLIWLLSSFVSACVESGVRPLILCRPGKS
ncbi:hypothetical protein N5D36_22440 [Pseudomonas mosselii]|uniref:hypothetical protein n=1 Tax=Pseudomonas mosselii TaxID=78327 RepID=UPI00244D34DA|nr:hypothetical protein [Pseudomonas mosselii]MDH0630484.1 hypothetical protein [Pseudomonas mosselii]MDH0680211.1 hypothetical protein [Pseudomonas mosselii]MDH0927829.1 hypothetical protein [Pseudomonas mosselii]MDH1137329.1 hypothetical protein [Pseudomonas mosselii]MDH1142044.1 hypothetical protein [Pseudomonas mosselii]